MYAAKLTQVIEAKTPQLMLQVEGEDGRVDPSMIRDDRAKERMPTSEDGAAIDHGGYQAAAVAFQQHLASGAAGAAGASEPKPAPSLEQLDNELDWD